MSVFFEVNNNFYGVYKNPHRKLKKAIDDIDAQKKQIRAKILEEAGEEYRPREIRVKILEASKDVGAYFWMHHNGVFKEVKIQHLLGFGGQKKAWHYNDEFALVLPNYDATDLELFNKHWKEAVEEEVRVSEFVNKIGLLSCRLQPIGISTTKDFASFIPAYLSESFDSFKRKNIFIIEGKSDVVGTWLKGKDQFLFQNPENKMKEECWDAVFEPLLEDIAKIVKYGIPAEVDALNIAIVNQGDDNFPHYQARYFGLDFSRKEGGEALPLKERVQLSAEEIGEEVSTLVSLYVGRVMEVEFHGFQEDYSSLRESLVNKYIKIVTHTFYSS